MVRHASRRSDRQRAKLYKQSSTAASTEVRVLQSSRHADEPESQKNSLKQAQRVRIRWLRKIRVNSEWETYQKR